MAESHKRTRTSSGGGGSPSDATAAVVKREQGGWAQSPTAAAASPVTGGRRAGRAPTTSPPPTAVNYQASSSGSGAEGSDDTGGRSDIVIVDKVLWLHCSGCFATLKPPIYKCEASGHKVCSACRGNPCRACANSNGAAAAASTYTRCAGDDLDGLMRALCVPCPYKAYSGYGCRGLVPYLFADDHRLSCLNPPCSCSVFPCSAGGGFLGSPQALHDHLTGPAHSWPTTEIETESRGKAQQLDLTLTGPHCRRLLVSKDDGGVFVLLAAAAGGGELTTAAHVSLTCLRASASAAAAGPQYWAMLWAHAPKDPVTGKEDRLQEEFVVQSRRSPCEIGTGEDDGTLLSLKRKYLHLHGEERKIMLYVRIVKLKSPSASSSAT